MAAATSLAELILKKWGDDIAGAAKELEEKIGFPESVANRIATGELPMDAESVAKRSQDQGYDETIYYHGSNKGDIKEITMSPSWRTNDNSAGFWATDNPLTASTYADDFRKGRIYPLRIKKGDSESYQYGGSDWGRPPEDVRAAGENTNDIAKNAFARGADSVEFKDIVDVASSIPGEQTLIDKELIDILKEEHGPDYIFDKRDAGILDYANATNRARRQLLGESNNISVKDGSRVRSANAAFDPEYTGSNIMGGLALPVTAGLLAAGQSEDADAGFVTRGGKTLLEAWHGSPHKFDKFSMDQIGTGEGAQAYGHGLYFADSEDVAREYRKLGQLKFDPQGEGLSSSVGLRRHADGDVAAREWLEKTHGDMETVNGDGWIDSIWEASEDAKSRAAGHLYRAEIDVTPESLLDWDKPLSEQPRAIQKIVTEGVPEFQGFIDELAGINPEAAELAEKMMYGPDSVRAGTEEASANWKKLQDLVGDSDIDLNRLHDATDAAYGRRDKWGATFYEELADSPEKAAGLLSDRGIKGIKYLDGDSRAVGNGTSNYVIFDDSLINIAERGNADPRLLAGTAAGAAGLLAAPMVKDSGMISSPRSETLFDLTMGARDLERRLEGSPASLLFPSGLVEYLETVNRREEDPNAMTRGMALLDVLPF